ncbi:HU family DNA-binding protein [Pseudalkalibacillus berkeleyi]|uniref:HU family DNA-binding protein n=1 Tax=Pseudalkalibacillus berkeleyi TaxID=1069813 RepID=A0ABS9H2S5_9BACL|nr:HU family DNA-binding protein [Pseudalkalibacillus berkeleyi]MCF6138406.1 HU family DNA-binding protein [Pseudalkalibacillus berkeleyi]
MNKRDLIQHVAEQTGLPKKHSTTAVNAVIDAITKKLTDGENVQLIGFGSFEVRQRQARTGRNPQTGEVIQIKATRTPAFKPGKQLKEAVRA